LQVIENDGQARAPEIYSQNKMQEALDDPRVKEVRVFKLKKGMEINIGNLRYRVVSVRHRDGKVILKPA
jgi:hypothetical protein